MGSPELVYLLVVLAAGVATAYWAGHQIGLDLSSVTGVVSMLGLTETGRLTHGAVGYGFVHRRMEALGAYAERFRPVGGNRVQSAGGCLPERLVTSHQD